MSKLICILLISILFADKVAGQLPDGSIVPDFTLKDIQGNVQNLYSYLNQGKYIAIDISATWCAPCWNYHGLRVMDSLYESHDLPGDKQWKVFFIEGDGSTSLADLLGTGTNTKGNWVKGSDYSIIDPPTNEASGFKDDFMINFYPTLYLICPDKKVYSANVVGGWPYKATWESITAKCVENDAILSIYPNPARNYIFLYLNLKASTTLKLKITDIQGHFIENKSFDNLNPGTQSIKYDVAYLNAGLYFFNITFNGTSITRKVIIQ